jgi:hypothetical protein
MNKNFLINNLNESRFNFGNVIQYLKKSKKYNFINFKNINIHIYYNNTLDLNFIERVIKRFHTISPIKTFNIYLIMTPIKRFIPIRGFIKPININGGYTTSTDNNIFIIRKEEFPKVILHEILHHNIRINNNYWKDENINKLKKHFNLSPNLNLVPNEAIVEFWATIYHLYYISKEYNLNYEKIFSEELNYSLFKSNQLLNKYKKKWYEESNAFCYIIFKTIFLYNMKEFLKIYTYPYNQDKITDFLINNYKLPIIKKNPTKIDNNSLRIMIYSDY